MGYRPLAQFGASSKPLLPSVDAPWKIFRGNMIPIWNFLITRVKSAKTVENIRRNITVHGDRDGGGSSIGLVNAVKEEGRGKGRNREKTSGESLSAAETREAALQERDLAAKEVERLMNIIRRQRKGLRAKMLEVSREEAERKRMLDEGANYRTTGFSLNLAVEQEKSVMDKWLPELKTVILNAQKRMEDCKYVGCLLDEWWEQPASNVVDWVMVDGQNVAAWHNHVKQLLAFYDKELM